MRRLKIFESNKNKAENLNKIGNPVFGITKFSDLTEEEFESMYLMPPRSAVHLAAECLVGQIYEPDPRIFFHDIPDSFDWRDYPNVVLTVKDQASCGSCWLVIVFLVNNDQGFFYGREYRRTKRNGE